MATLNVRDALSYLDQVKVQFTDHPDVYNRFLDIMKDFKSQAIDTPGVIERVSMLFRGQPSLIQGFNTFLPPGYRIECSFDQHEGNVITVTTPNGTTTQTLSGGGGLIPPPPPPPVPPRLPRPSSDMPGSAAPPAPSSSAPPPPPGPVPRGEYVDRVPSSVRPPGGLGLPPSMPSPPGAYAPPMGYDPLGRGPPGQAPPPPAAGPPLEPVSRPPVEFNHAISYVNKIKQRFSGDPDTYKQFLEILQTYQKEQRPIHEVYAQVTVLFDHAKDLLEEFKQFLPDTGAAAHDGPGGSGGLFGMLGHMTNGGPPPPPPGMGVEGSGMPPYDPMPRPPPPPSKKRMVHEAPAAVPEPKSSGRKRSKKSDMPSQPRGTFLPPPPGTGVHGEVMGDAVYPHGAPLPPGYEALPPEGYLPAPGPPSYAPPHMMGGEMMPPLAPQMATVDEVAFFERVKKHLDDRTTYLDFLKLLNLYAQDMIGVATLVDRAALFLSGRPELLSMFKGLVGYDMGRHGWLENEDPVLDNVPALERERFDLSVQKSCGPSYRKLPKSEVNLSCSGRDALCWEVLNDGWVSYPTWASEGESFNPHKKNVYEDALYRSEEERHEYDYHIEANLRTIALLEPIAARIAAMDAEERAAFRLKPGLGGQSKSIYQRIMKKVYGRQHGLEVIAALHDNPSIAVPIVLARLKQKDEEWKRAQREWNKVWREVDARNFYKALDHQGVNFKSADKKAITTKALVHEIETLVATQQQRRLAMDPSLPRLAPRSQLSFVMDDPGVCADILRLVAHYMDRAALSDQDRHRLEHVCKTILPRMLGAGPDALADLLKRSDDEEEAEDVDNEEGDGDDDDEERARAPAVETWHVHMPSTSTPHAVPTSVQLFGNTTMYVFLRLWCLLYARLHRLKHKDMASEHSPKVNPLAADLGLMDTASGPAGLVNSIAMRLPGSKRPEHTAHLSEADQAALALQPSQYYAVLLEVMARHLDHELDQASFEEAVRYMYTHDGYVVYTVDKVIQALVKSALSISTDAKCQELLDNYTSTLRDCDALCEGPAEARDVQLYRRLIAARMAAEQTVGRDEHLFRIEARPQDGTPLSATLHIQLLSHDDLTLDEPHDREQRWLQYIASYCLWTPTEGLPAKTSAPFLHRNLPPTPEPEAEGTRFIVKNALDIRVCIQTYRLFFVQDTEDVFVRLQTPPSPDETARRDARRRDRWHAWLSARHEAMSSPEAAEQPST